MIRSFCQMSRRLATHHGFRRVLLAAAAISSYVFFYHRCALPNAIDNFLDLPSFYAASVAVFRDHLSPYDVGRLTRINGLEFRTYPFLYPPPSLFLFQPLATTSLAQAKHILTSLNHLTLIPTLLLIPSLMLKLSPRREFWRFSFCLLYPLYSCPLILTVRYGQTNIVMLAALVAFWIAAQRDKSVLAGLCLCVAILCKTTPVLFIPMLLVVGRWKVVAYTLLSFMMVSVVSLFSLPSGIWSEWLFRVAPSSGYMNEPFGLFPPASVWNQSLNGALARHFTRSSWSDPGFHSPGLGKILTYCAAASVMALSAITLRGVRHSPRAVSLLSAITLPMIFLVAPFSWEHHGAYLIPAILFVVCHQIPGSKLWRISALAAALITAITFTSPALMLYRLASALSLWALALAITWRDRVELRGIPPSGRSNELSPSERRSAQSL
ncbi:MAG: hypothetical protein RL326_1382 [Pseudomonadota bacterium]